MSQVVAVTAQTQDVFTVLEFGPVYHWKRTRPNGISTVSREAWLSWDEAYESMVVVAECYHGVVNQFDQTFYEHTREDDFLSDEPGYSESLQPYLW